MKDVGRVVDTESGCVRCSMWGESRHVNERRRIKVVSGGRLAACGLNLRMQEEQEFSGKQKGRKQKVKEEPSWAGLRSGLTDSSCV